MAWTVSTGPAGEPRGSTVEALSRVGQSGRYAEASSGGLGWGSTGEVRISKALLQDWGTLVSMEQ